MTLEHDHAYTSATNLARMIRDREIAPTELLENVIDRIEERNPDLNAIVFTGYDDARQAAAYAEQQVLAGGELGALHGVPTLIKDLFDFKPGWPATFGGVPALSDQVIDGHCMFAERIEQAGAVIVGKTNSPVMGMRGTCDNPLFGPSCNPFDTTKNTGGSSGGSAGAVADGLVPFAEGTDAGGSIRIPAAWCGVYGFKGSWGRVPAPLRPNAFGGTSPFVAEGPITRSVDDAALVMSVLSGYDSRDPYALADSPDMMSALDGNLRGKRIAYSPDFGVYPVDPEVAAVVAAAALAFEEAGATVEIVNIKIPYDHIELADLWCRMIAPINIATLEDLKAAGIDLLGEHRSSMPPEYVRRIEEGYRLGTVEMGRDQAMRTSVSDAVQTVLDQYDFLLTPTVSAQQVDNADDGNTIGPSVVNGVEVERLIGWCMTYFINFSGHPAASIPAGMVGGRLPVGMQIIGGRYDDVGVLAASRVFEQLRPWEETYDLCRNR
ncbi:amidase [Ilumatobacter sp.]|uniref:amidase n=1 Tax=Ilumatobacter sp. TaxID=1967498 RepID=UPI0030B4978D